MTEEEQAQDALSRLNETRDRLMGEIRKGIIGQDEVIEQLLITMLARGHCLLTGIPGLGKTLLVKTLPPLLDGLVFRTFWGFKIFWILAFKQHFF